MEQTFNIKDKLLVFPIPMLTFRLVQQKAIADKINPTAEHW